MDSLVLKLRASRNSFQEFTNTSSAAVTTPGAESGRTTRVRAPTRVVPSTMAADSRSRGMALKNATSVRMPMGRLSAA